jgi:indolepyruvate ferredoxin oxidoreductase beta subunit
MSAREKDGEVCEHYSIVHCGVGGQGIVLMAHIVGEACAIQDLPVVAAEDHGLSQRSGSVLVHQRLGTRALSPLVPYGEGDMVLALEPIEAQRYFYFLKPGGRVITSTNIIHPNNESQALVKKEKASYIQYKDIVGNMRKAGASVIEIDALALAKQAGNALAENVVLVGALTASPCFPIRKDVMVEAVKRLVPSKAVDVNLRAFELGYDAFKD